ncbi:MAG: 50S ribosomal protein L16 [Verrucomicrobiota bacterium]
MAKLLPSRTKYRKVQKGRIRGLAKGGDTLAFGDFGIQSLERGRLTASQLEAARVAINRYLKRKGKVWIRVFPHKPVTKKPAETRQGKGKGSVEYWCAVIKPGVILFEVGGTSQTLAREAMRLADGKLPFKCRFISREEMEQF